MHTSFPYCCPNSFPLPSNYLTTIFQQVDLLCSIVQLPASYLAALYLSSVKLTGKEGKISHWHEFTHLFHLSILLSSLTFASFTCLDLNATLFDRTPYSIKACPDLSVSLTGVSWVLFKYLSYMLFFSPLLFILIINRLFLLPSDTR